MSDPITQIKNAIEGSVTELTKSAAFSDWLEQQNLADGDVVILNNSFIYRKPVIKTSKNEQYLCLKVRIGKLDTSKIFVAKTGEINSDFKLFSARSSNLPQLVSLDQAIQGERRRLGRLVFVLIGKLEDVPTNVSVQHGSVRELRFEPDAKSEAAVIDTGKGGKAIVVNQIVDPESAWNAVNADLERELGEDMSGLETAFGEAFEKLRDEARLKLVLPAPGQSATDNSFMRRLRESVSKQREEYCAALQKCAKNGGAANSYLRDVMRIAYNFADDAIKVLHLLVSVADVKPLVLWCTIHQHLAVAQAFRNLPWTSSRKKPSLERYREIIAGARNRAFHNLFAFDRTIEADLMGVDVKARRLTLLPAHGRRKATIPFDYDDREMVEILADLTRAPEVVVPLEFWRKNTAVMESFEKLMESTENALWLLNQLEGKEHEHLD